MTAPLVVLVGAGLALGSAVALRAEPVMTGLLAVPWVAGLILLALRRTLGIVLLQASAVICGLALAYPVALLILYGGLGPSLRELTLPLLLLDCVLIAALTWRLRPPSETLGSLLVVVWGVPLLSIAAAYNFVQVRAKAPDLELRAQMNEQFRGMDEVKRLVDCVVRYPAANAQRYPADARAIQQQCAAEWKLTYYQVEYVTAPGATDFSMCVVPLPGAPRALAPGPVLFGPSGEGVATNSHPGSACGDASVMSANGLAPATHHCLLRRQMRGDLQRLPNFTDVAPSGDGCLRFDFQGTKVTESEMVIPAGRLLLLPPGDPWSPRMLHCDRNPAVPARVWSSRNGFQSASAELAKLCN